MNNEPRDDRHRLLHEQARACSWHSGTRAQDWCHWRRELERFHARHGCAQ
jgi:hypothetical protein